MEDVRGCAERGDALDRGIRGDLSEEGTPGPRWKGEKEQPREGPAEEHPRWLVHGERVP